MQYATSARGLVAEIEAKIAAKGKMKDIHHSSFRRLIKTDYHKMEQFFLSKGTFPSKRQSQFHLKRIPTSYVLLLCWTLNMICGLHNCNIQLLQISKSIHEYQHPSTLQETSQGPSQGPQEFIPCNHYLLLPN